MLKTVEEIGRVVQNAHFFNPQNWSREAMPSTVEGSPVEAVTRFFALLAERQVDYALVGGVALLHYVKGRNTQDLDLIIAGEDLDRLPEIEIAERDVYFARGRFQGLRVDFLLTDNPLFRRVQREYVRRERLLGQGVPLATVEGLLLLKLYALPSLYRQGDFVRVGLYENDVAVLVYEYEPDMERLLDILAEYVGEGDMTALREIVAEIEERVRRFKGGSR